MLVITVMAVDDFDADTLTPTRVNMELFVRFFIRPEELKRTEIEMMNDTAIFCTETPEEIDALMTNAKHDAYVKLRESFGE